MPCRRVEQREKKIIKLVLSHLNFPFCKFCTHVEKKKKKTPSTVRRPSLISHFCFLSISIPVMPRFAEQVEVAIEALSTNPPQPFEENEFIDASRLVYDGVRDIRKAVLMIRVC